jgi:hypothetical protein
VSAPWKEKHSSLFKRENNYLYLAYQTFGQMAQKATNHLLAGLIEY